MQSILRKIYYSLVALGLTITLSAQDPFHIVYNTNDGLPSDEVYDLSIDKNRSIWLTTDRGLCKYDGYDFKTYTTNDGLINNTNFEITEGPDNSFYLGSPDGRYTVYKNGVFEPFEFNNTILEITLGQHLSGTKITDDYIFFLCRLTTDFYYRLNIKNGVIKAYSKKILDKYSLPYIFGHQPNMGFGKDRIVIGKNEFIIFKETLIVQTAEKIFELLPDRVTDHIYTDRSKNLWACTDQGIFCYKNGDINKAPQRFFQNSFVSSIIEDHDGNYWVSTLDKGIFFVPTFQINEILLDTKSIGTNKVVLLVPLNNNLIIGMSNGTLLSTNRNDIQTVRNIAENRNAISHYFSIGDTTQVLTTKFWEEGDKLKTKQSNFQFPLVEKFSLSVQSNGAKLKVNETIEIDFNEYGGPLKSRRVTKLLTLSEDSILIGTRKGLLYMDPENPKEIIDLGALESTLNIRITDLVKSTKGGFWLSTIGNGILYKSGNSIRKISIDNGLSSNIINAMHIQNDSIIWLGTNRGLDKITFAKKDPLANYSIKNYSTSHGLLSNYINAVAYWDDKVWVGYNNGINYFDPKAINSTIQPAKIFLDSVEVLSTNRGFQKTTDLRPHENDLVFHYTAVSFNKPKEKEFYRFALSKDDELPKWFFTNDRTARFTNLTAGAYTFTVNARNRNDQWSNKPASVSFNIQAHYSSTWWFWALCAVIIFSIIGYFLYLRQRSTRQQQKLQEASYRTQKAELAALRSQMNPHFIFNSLNSIQNYMFKNEVENANYYLGQFSSLVRQSLEFSKLSQVTLEQELSFLKIYMELEQMRFPDSFDFTLKVAEEIPKDLYFIPPLLIQPILENSIKHGFKHIDKRGKLSLEIIEIQDRKSIKIIIKDNGKGIPQKESQDSITSKADRKSLGLEIIKDRIKLLNRDNKKNKAVFKYYNLKDAQGFCTELTLPITFTQ